MSSFISQESIDEVNEKTDIVSLVGEYLPLSQRGNDWWGCCPFHHEKTPSFSVSPEKKFYYCFGCHASGTAINFIMDMEKLSFPDAIEHLAKKAGVALHYKNAGAELSKEDSFAKLKGEYIDLYNRVATTFHFMLMETPQGKFALDYILKRGLTRETLEKFKIGYSPENRKWLRTFLSERNFSKEFLDKSGLFSSKHPDYAFFSDRLMFPIFDRKGDVVAMGGRFLRGDPQKSPKYLNSGDLIQYKKGNTLYAFNFAKQAIREHKKVIFCEGYMDCIAYHQCGINYAVAPLGTALTDEQINIIKPFVEEVLLSFDSDGAGQNATKKAILMCRRKGLTVKIIKLSGGKDPAEIMLNFGPETLTNEVKHAILDNDYLLSKLQEVYPKKTPEGKAKASLVFFTYIDSLQSDVQKDACLDQLCQTYEIDQEAARKDYVNRDKLSQRFSRNVNTEQEKEADHSKIKVTAELRAVLTAVTDDVSLFQKMCKEISVGDLEDPLAKKLFVIMEDCSKSGSFSVSSILGRCDDDNFRKLIGKSGEEYSSKIEQSVSDSIVLLKRNSLERKRLSLVNQIKDVESRVTGTDEELLKDLVSQKMDIDTQIKLLKG